MEEGVARYGVANRIDLVEREVLGDFRRDDCLAWRRQGFAQHAEHARRGDDDESIELVPRARTVERLTDLLREQLRFVPLGAALTVDCVPVAVSAAEATSGSVGLQFAVRSRCVVVQRATLFERRLRLREIEERRIALVGHDDAYGDGLV